MVTPDNTERNKELLAACPDAMLERATEDLGGSNEPIPQLAADSTEIPLVTAVLANVREVYSEEAANSLANNPILRGWEEHPNEIQRGLINRILVRKLLAYRARHHNGVVDVVLCLAPDGDDSSWMNVFKIAVLPFLKANKVQI